MPDRYAVVWTRAGGAPVKMGNLVATPQECRFSYEPSFLNTGLPGLSLIAPPLLLKTAPLIHKASERFPLHPRFMALIPPNLPGNLQRRVYAELLAKLDPPPAPGFETEWAILMMAGHNGIGHVDVFQSDLAAQQWYGQPTPSRAWEPGRSGVWRVLREEVQQTGHLDVASAKILSDFMGPTPTVGGMTTKLLAAIPNRNIWDGTLALPGTRKARDASFVDVLVKIEQPGYEGIAALEDLAYQIHDELNFPVPRRWHLTIEGLHVLAVERFDRTPQGHPIPFESLFTVFAGGSNLVTATTDLELPEVADWLRKLPNLCALSVTPTLRGVFRRISLALMLGNGDLHLDNLGLLGGYREVGLSPVYDPTPMRAWSRHNQRLATPIDFQPGISIYQQIADVGAKFGLNRSQAVNVLREMFEATSGYVLRIASLADVPDARKDFLSRVVQAERQLVLAWLAKAPLG
jgi:serine/threonine-protein kinase HipA